MDALTCFKLIVGAREMLMRNYLFLHTSRISSRSRLRRQRGWGQRQYKAEAATFGMAIAPRVNTCSPADAKIIYDNMKIGAASLDWAAVKAALERNYQCMGVTCADIGAYTKDGVAKYEACTDGGSGAVIGGTVGGVVGGVLIIGLILKFTVFKGAGAAAKAGSSTGANA